MRVAEVARHRDRCDTAHGRHRGSHRASLSLHSHLAVIRRSRRSLTLHLRIPPLGLALSIVQRNQSTLDVRQRVDGGRGDLAAECLAESVPQLADSLSRHIAAARRPALRETERHRPAGASNTRACDWSGPKFRTTRSFTKKRNVVVVRGSGRTSSQQRDPRRAGQTCDEDGSIAQGSGRNQNVVIGIVERAAADHVVVPTAASQCRCGTRSR